MKDCVIIVASTLEKSELGNSKIEQKSSKVFCINQIQKQLGELNEALDIIAPTLESLIKAAHITNTTNELSEFFDNLDLVIVKLKELVCYEDQNQYMEGSPTKDLESILDSKDLTIKDFIDRCCNSIISDLNDCNNLDEAYKIQDRYSCIWTYEDKLSDDNKNFL